MLADLLATNGVSEFCELRTSIGFMGYGGVPEHPRRWLTLCVGGQGRSAAALVSDRLRASLDDYEVIDTLDDIPRQYRGLHPDNPINRVRSEGVQIELPPRVRGVSPIWADHDFELGPWVPHTAALLDAQVARHRTRRSMTDVLLLVATATGAQGEQGAGSDQDRRQDHRPNRRPGRGQAGSTGPRRTRGRARGHLSRAAAPDALDLVVGHRDRRGGRRRGHDIAAGRGR
ncbi:MAG: poly-gamma-glutamate hydrolase family protein [Acidimicrobiaceae bacterium]|nr:poly-gamma-glutamate hydrolase family protein [Acidimicrobiaceae bacterium]